MPARKDYTARRTGSSPGANAVLSDAAAFFGAALDRQTAQIVCGMRSWSSSGEPPWLGYRLGLLVSNPDWGARPGRARLPLVSPPTAGYACTRSQRRFHDAAGIDLEISTCDYDDDHAWPARHGQIEHQSLLFQDPDPL